MSAVKVAPPSVRYIDTKDVAKLIRTALRESFPDTKFSVRISRYSGGSSIDVSWMDGPAAVHVDSIAKTFKGGYFDSSTDYKGGHVHQMDGESVSFGADFVFVRREYSDDHVQRSIDAVACKYGDTDAPTVEDYRLGRAWHTSPCADRGNGWNQRLCWQTLVSENAFKRTRYLPLPSPTAARVTGIERSY